MRKCTVRFVGSILSGTSLPILLGGWLGLAGSTLAAESAFRVGGKSVTVDQLYKENQGTFFEMEKKKYDLVERMAHDKYLEFFWNREAQKAKVSTEQAEKQYLDKRVKISDAEFTENFARFKEHPQLKSLDRKEQESQIRGYLAEKKKGEVYQAIIDEGLAKGELVVDYPKPVEPVYDVKITDKDAVRYGPGENDVKPMGCEEDKCPITIVEYSEFECPFCSRVLPDVKRLLTDYKGKIRWTVRDFPLSFHARARPAAVAAKCAASQGKYWSMYYALFDNQRALSDADFRTYGTKIGLNPKKFEECLTKTPADILTAIEHNIKTGTQFGVSGTPAFFINGRRLSGALPYAEFKKVIDEELKSPRKS
jgi:protein-disulfide isomerase